MVLFLFKYQLMIIKKFYITEIHCVWYSLKLLPAFSYNVLGYLNDNLTQNISVREGHTVV